MGPPAGGRGRRRLGKPPPRRSALRQQARWRTTWPAMARSGRGAAPGGGAPDGSGCRERLEGAVAPLAARRPGRVERPCAGYAESYPSEVRRRCEAEPVSGDLQEDVLDLLAEKVGADAGLARSGGGFAPVAAALQGGKPPGVPRDVAVALRTGARDGSHRPARARRDVHRSTAVARRRGPPHRGRPARPAAEGRVDVGVGRGPGVEHRGRRRRGYRAPGARSVRGPDPPPDLDAARRPGPRVRRRRVVHGDPPPSRRPGRREHPFGPHGLAHRRDPALAAGGRPAGSADASIDRAGRR